VVAVKMLAGFLLSALFASSVEAQGQTVQWLLDIATADRNAAVVYLSGWRDGTGYQLMINAAGTEGGSDGAARMEMLGLCLLRMENAETLLKQLEVMVATRRTDTATRARDALLAVAVEACGVELAGPAPR
jgi:hypothetical protein